MRSNTDEQTLPEDRKMFEFTAIRQPGNARVTPSWRFQVSDGCRVILFDDGHTRFLMDETADYKVTGTNRSVHRPGAKMIETKSKQ